jgi:tetratricopeptide (TPR) repeat protein
MRLNGLLIFIVFIFLISCEVENNPRAVKLVNEGVKKMDLREYSKALTLFREAMKLNMNDELAAITFRNLSIVYQDLEDFDSAIKYAQKGYETAPNDTYIYYINRAEFNLLKNDVHTAINDLNSAKLLSPDKMEVYHTLCLIYSGEYGDAYFNPELSEFYAKKSFKISPSEITKEQLGSVYFQNEKYVQAVKVFTELYFSDPSNKKYEFYLGQSLYFAGDERGGEKHMKQAADRDETCKAMYHEIFEIGQQIEQ